VPQLVHPVLRAELSELEKRWLYIYLARSYEFTERVARTLKRWQGEVVQP
jgi:hypothetical protein